MRRATARSDDPVLCMIKQDAVKFIALSSRRLVVSWEYTVNLPTKSTAALVIPPVVARIMTSEAIKRLINIRLEDHQAIMAITDQSGSCEISWHSDVTDFPAPPEFGQFISPPHGLVEVNYLTISDAVHQAIAKLVTIESAGQARRDKLAILIDFGPQKLIVDGRAISSSEAVRYYFDPRLIVRALEFAKGDRIGVAVTGLSTRSQAILSFVANKDNCQVHCALLSIGLDTQKLYPLPPTLKLG
jgi:hypothetical protein